MDVKSTLYDALERQRAELIQSRQKGDPLEIRRQNTAEHQTKLQLETLDRCLSAVPEMASIVNGRQLITPLSPPTPTSTIEIQSLSHHVPYPSRIAMGDRARRYDDMVRSFPILANATPLYTRDPMNFAFRHPDGRITEIWACERANRPSSENPSSIQTPRRENVDPNEFHGSILLPMPELQYGSHGLFPYKDQQHHVVTVEQPIILQESQQTQNPQNQLPTKVSRPLSWDLHSGEPNHDRYPCKRARHMDTSEYPESADHSEQSENRPSLATPPKSHIGPLRHCPRTPPRPGRRTEPYGNHNPRNRLIPPAVKVSQSFREFLPNAVTYPVSDSPEFPPHIPKPTPQRLPDILRQHPETIKSLTTQGSGVGPLDTLGFDDHTRRQETLHCPPDKYSHSRDFGSNPFETQTQNNAYEYQQYQDVTQEASYPPISPDVSPVDNLRPTPPYLVRQDRRLPAPMAYVNTCQTFHNANNIQNIQNQVPFTQNATQTSIDRPNTLPGGRYPPTVNVTGNPQSNLSNGYDLGQILFSRGVGLRSNLFPEPPAPDYTSLQLPDLASTRTHSQYLENQGVWQEKGIEYGQNLEGQIGQAWQTRQERILPDPFPNHDLQRSQMHNLQLQAQFQRTIDVMERIMVQRKREEELRNIEEESRRKAEKWQDTMRKREEAREMEMRRQEQESRRQAEQWQDAIRKREEVREMEVRRQEQDSRRQVEQWQDRMRKDMERRASIHKQDAARMMEWQEANRKKAAELQAARELEWQRRFQKTECIVCGEQYAKMEMLTTACGHSYCFSYDCLQGLFLPIQEQNCCI
jgi:hypothetical protein